MLNKKSCFKQGSDRIPCAFWKYHCDSSEGKGVEGQAQMGAGERLELLQDSLDLLEKHRDCAPSCSPTPGVSSGERGRGLVSRKEEITPKHQAVGRAMPEGLCSGPGRMKSDYRKHPKRDASEEWRLGQRAIPQRHNPTCLPVTTLTAGEPRLGRPQGVLKGLTLM